ncbi:MAG: hypothetical protein L0Y79_03655 [Chlorobi bacterium]|nr:hypothetical protein [Chlorobiota bacterium]MCI0717364.1 hypothetical protein [Chlorobiota bacterium]
MVYKIFLILSSFFLIFFLILFNACGNKEGDKTQTQIEKKEFAWKDDVSLSDIPDFPVKGMIRGKEVRFQYINFERWRGTNDNVINFSVVKPEQDCGFIENFTGFTVMNKGAAIEQGEFLKPKFSDDPKTYNAFYKLEGGKSTAEWNCALKVESISGKIVKGQIALFFNDTTKSWVAGKFEAIICNN